MRGDADHDHLTRLDEWRNAHREVHFRDDQQHTRDYTELQRRLDVLNHAHEEARRKESAFASKDEMTVTQDDLIRRIENVQASVGICLPRETFDAAQKTVREDAAKRDDQIANLFIQVQGLASSSQGSQSGAQRVQNLVFALFAAAGVIIALVAFLTR